MSYSPSIQTIHEHTIYVNALRPGSLVLDLGANEGLFSLEMAERFGCRCVAFEPSPAVFARIPDHANIDKYNAAVAGNAGVMPFHISPDPLGSTLNPIAGEPYVQTVSVETHMLEQLAADLGLDAIDLVKMDVEGVELAVLDACSDTFLQSVGQFTIEFHDFNDAVPRAEVERCVARFQALGFLIFKKTWRDWSDVLLLNPSRVDMSKMDFAWNKYVLRYWFGLGRVLRKKAGVAG